jgi:glycoprotein-N-acetylgalactosamine 3-beta-galactosyltransferase
MFRFQSVKGCLLVLCFVVFVIIIATSFYKKDMWTLRAAFITPYNSALEPLYLKQFAVKAPRVTCMIFTRKQNWETRGLSVRHTWSQHCDRRRFFYSNNSTFDPQNGLTKVNDSVALNISDGREYLWQKTMTALIYSFRNYNNDTSWFLKADDDTYILWKNLMSYIAQFDPLQPRYLGCHLRGTFSHIPKGYNSGGGYLLSWKAAEQVVNEGIVSYPKQCSTSKVGGWEDVNMGDCLQMLKIYPTETRDYEMRLRFNWENPFRFLQQSLKETAERTIVGFFRAKYKDAVFGNYYKSWGEKMLSNESISFHHLTASQIYMMDFLIHLTSKEELRPSNASH